MDIKEVKKVRGLVTRLFKQRKDVFKMTEAYERHARDNRRTPDLDAIKSASETALSSLKSHIRELDMTAIPLLERLMAYAGKPVGNSTEVSTNLPDNYRITLSGHLGAVSFNQASSSDYSARVRLYFQFPKLTANNGSSNFEFSTIEDLKAHPVACGYKFYNFYDMYGAPIGGDVVDTYIAVDLMLNDIVPKL